MAKGSTNGKDPCISWYWNDWGGGTRTLSRFLKGCYMDLLEAQFNNGSLSLDEIKTVLGSDFGSAWPTLQKKFKIGQDGLYRNERLLFETIKRKDFNKSRRKNLGNEENMDDHMGNENGIDNDFENLLKKRKEKFSIEVMEVINSDKVETTYEIKVLNDFIDYWTEHSPKGKKMRFEKETVFDISRRWGTWKKNNKTFKNEHGTTKTESTTNAALDIASKRGWIPINNTGEGDSNSLSTG